jgi:hypothetical protein
MTYIPPPPEPEPPPLSVIEDRFSVKRMSALVGTVALTSVGIIEGLHVAATLEIVDHIDRKRAQFSIDATGASFAIGPWPVGGSVICTPGPEVRFETFRLLGPCAPTINLQSFEGTFTVFIDGGGGAGPVVRGGTLSFSFDALESNGADTQPQVIRVPGGDAQLTLPGIAAGAVVPLGQMTMNGKPANL